MALAPPLITVEAADGYLPVEIFAEWHELTDGEKEYHIQKASDYVRLRWTCADEDFATPVLSDDAQRAVAYYAEASRAGNLYASVSQKAAAPAAGPMVGQTLKAGSLEQTMRYSDAGGISTGPNNPLQSAHDIFAALGCSFGGGSTRELRRV